MITSDEEILIGAWILCYSKDGIQPGYFLELCFPRGWVSEASYRIRKTSRRHENITGHYITCKTKGHSKEGCRKWRNSLWWSSVVLYFTSSSCSCKIHLYKLLVCVIGTHVLSKKWKCISLLGRLEGLWIILMWCDFVPSKMKWNAERNEKLGKLISWFESLDFREFVSFVVGRLV